MNIAIATTDNNHDISKLVQQLHLPLVDIDDRSFDYLLVATGTQLELRSVHAPRQKPFVIDFLSGKIAYRQAHSARSSELLARAVGIKKNYFPYVVDATAGLGRDAFVLAYLGCSVVMLERSPIMSALLEDGLRRLKLDEHFKNMALSLIAADSMNYLNQLTEKPDVIYLDPMYPHRDKSALVKKEMRILRDIVGGDEDTSLLLENALKFASQRVVVKRPRLAKKLEGRDPEFVIEGKTQRFDVYKIF